MPNVSLMPAHPLPSFRKFAIGAWRAPQDPTVYGAITLPVERVLQYLAAQRRATGTRVTLSHFVAKALAQALRAVPDVNSVMIRGRPRRRREVNIGLQVSLDEKTNADLTVVAVPNADQLTLAEIASLYDEQIRQAKTGRDRQIEHTRNQFRQLPPALTRTALHAISFLGYTLNLDLSILGMKKDMFGSALISNIGSLGLDEAYVPLTPFTHIPLQLALGGVRRTPVADGAQVVVKRCVRISASFDHRLFDGVQAAQVCAILREAFDDPARICGAPSVSTTANKASAANSD